MQDIIDGLEDTHIDTNVINTMTGRTVYPWIHWFDNSCLHDSFVTLFFMNIFNKDELV